MRGVADSRPSVTARTRRAAVRKPMHDDIRRSIASVSLGATRDMDKRDARRRQLGQRATVQMFQTDIAGSAGTALAFTVVSLDFDYRFYFSPGTNDTELDVPNFAFGAVEVDADVMLTAAVSAWARDPDNEAVTGAAVRIGFVAPGAEDRVHFAGKVHLQFTGWASMYEDETEIQE